MKKLLLIVAVVAVLLAVVFLSSKNTDETVEKTAVSTVQEESYAGQETELPPDTSFDEPDTEMDNSFEPLEIEDEYVVELDEEEDYQGAIG